MESLTDYGNSGMDNDTKVCHFLKDIMCTELESAVNVVWAQWEKHGTDFDAIVSYLSKMITTKGSSMQSVHIAKARSLPVKPKVVAFAGKIEYENYPKAF